MFVILIKFKLEYITLCHNQTNLPIPVTICEDGKNSEIDLQLNKPHTKSKPNESWGRKARYLTQML